MVVLGDDAAVQSPLMWQLEPIHNKHTQLRRAVATSHDPVCSVLPMSSSDLQSSIPLLGQSISADL